LIKHVTRRRFLASTGAAAVTAALTSSSDEEIRRCLAMLKVSSSCTGFMHESFNKDDPARSTRSWFAWVNTLFGELIALLAVRNPELLKA